PTSWRLLLVSSWWTLVNWVVKLAVLAWVIQQLVPIDFGRSLLGAIGGELTSVLPVYSIAGAGTYEAGGVVTLVPAAIDPQEAFKSAVNLHLFLLACTLLSRFLSYLLPRSRSSQPYRSAFLKSLSKVRALYGTLYLQICPREYRDYLPDEAQ